MNGKPEYRWGVNGHKQHLFPPPYVCVQAICGSGYSGDNPSYKSKAKKCKVCEKRDGSAPKGVA